MLKLPEIFSELTKSKFEFNCGLKSGQKLKFKHTRVLTIHLCFTRNPLENSYEDNYDYISLWQSLRIYF